MKCTDEDKTSRWYPDERALMASNIYTVVTHKSITVGLGKAQAHCASISEPAEDLLYIQEHFRFFLDDYAPSSTADALQLRGWVVAPYETYAPRAVSLDLFDGDRHYELPLVKEARPDVAATFGLGAHAIEVGFRGDVNLSSIPNGSYTVRLIVENAGPLDFNEKRSDAIESNTPARIAQALDIGLAKLPFVSNRFRNALRSKISRGGRATPCEAISSLEVLDRRLDHMVALSQTDPAAWFAYAQTFRFDDATGSAGSAPLSSQYRSEQMALYLNITGKTGYKASDSEPIELHIPAQLDPHPFPFDSRNPDHIGNHLFNLGGIFKALDKKPPATVLEYGMGSGFTSLHLAAAGFDVIGVDINKDCVEIARQVAQGRGIESLRTVVGEFGFIPEDAGEIEIVLFYESFHHCWEFDRLLAQLHQVTSPDCTLIFGNEPIYDDFPKPWGLRTDGQSLFEIRTKGWLELGFRTDFFSQVLRDTGWNVEKLFTEELMSPVFRAHKIN